MNNDLKKAMEKLGLQILEPSENIKKMTEEVKELSEMEMPKPPKFDGPSPFTK
jgi:hypothetical protein